MKSNGLNSKVVLVAGAERETGTAIVEAFAGDGGKAIATEFDLLGPTDEIAKALLWLSADLARYTYDQVAAVDHGYLSH